MASYLDGLLQKANQTLVTNSKRATNQAMLGSQQPVTNTTRRTNQGIETNTRSQQTQSSSLQTILKQAKAYDPFAVVNKTQAELQKPLTYLNDVLTNTKPVGYTEEYYSTRSFSDLKYRQPTAAELAQQTADYKSKKSRVKPGSRIRVPNTRFVVTDPTAEVNKTMLQGLVDEQTKYLGKDLANVDTKTLSSADWTSFNNLTGDVAKYNSLRASYLAKNNKTKVDTDWIKQYDTLLADTYKAMSGEIPKILTNARSSYDIISKTRDTGIAAIEALMPLDKQSKKQTKDVATTDQRSQIANRVKLVSNYETKKPNPVFATRPV